MTTPEQWSDAVTALFRDPDNPEQTPETEPPTTPGNYVPSEGKNPHADHMGADMRAFVDALFGLT